MAKKFTWKKKVMKKDKTLSGWSIPEPVFDEATLPRQIFEKFFTMKEIERICQESNKCAQSRRNSTFKMTPQRLQAFTVILLLSGYSTLPQQEMYWQRRDDSFNPIVTGLMTKNEFEETKQYLQFADNSTVDKADKSAKVRPLFDAINKQSPLNYKPTQHVSVDESEVPYFGKRGTKQYIHGKPINFGYKLWVMASPFGYCIH